jgi:hypothetical protein
MKRFFFVYVWVFLTVVTVGASAFYLQAQSQHLQLAQTTPKNGSLGAIASSEETPARVGEVKGISTSIEAEDARTEILTNFLDRHDSPLTPHDEYAQKLVDIADKYQLDFRLLPAIAMQESNLCKKIPEGSYNCLGFGITATSTLKFDSFEASFERAAKSLKKNYVDQGLTTPEEIMAKYTPSSNGSWAHSLNQWMTEMRYDDRSKGKNVETQSNVVEFASGSGDAGQVSAAGSNEANATATPTPVLQLQPTQ